MHGHVNVKKMNHSFKTQFQSVTQFFALHLIQCVPHVPSTKFIFIYLSTLSVELHKKAQWIIYDMEEIIWYLILGSLAAIAWRDAGKNQDKTRGINHVTAQISTGYLPNKSAWRYS
jgi:uncharacterized membrane protein SirB2